MKERARKKMSLLVLSNWILSINFFSALLFYTARLLQNCWKVEGSLNIKRVFGATRLRRSIDSWAISAGFQIILYDIDEISIACTQARLVLCMVWGFLCVVPPSCQFCLWLVLRMRRTACWAEFFVYIYLSYTYI